jgi:hypothetical protein
MIEGWRTVEADGCVWQVRSVVSPDMGVDRGQAVLEFVAESGNIPPRRVVVDSDALANMDEAALRSAYLKALPIGGDHYGRPGKRMTDLPGS